MRQLDVERKAELSAAALLNTKAAKAEGMDMLDAHPVTASVAG